MALYGEHLAASHVVVDDPVVGRALADRDAHR